jgi:hypothetical protein
MIKSVSERMNDWIWGYFFIPVFKNAFWKQIHENVYHISTYDRLNSGKQQQRYSSVITGHE